MDSNVVHNLREWAPLIALEKIPTKIMSGIFPSDFNFTCIDAIPEFLALGTDAGIVFWYNRYNGEFQKLYVEITSPITYIKIVSSVEYMIAVGTRNSQVNVFQIQKEIPSDLEISGPLAKSKPMQRYTIRDLHKSSITYCEWSKNGMKLFSGDKSGLVVLTEFDYQNNLSKSIEILNENYSIVQISLHKIHLLVSTLYRTIICEPDKTDMKGKWRSKQVGKTDRKSLGEFGATLKIEELKSPKIIACRPGFRFWLSDCNGLVEKTFIFKDAPLMRPSWEIPLLNPNQKSTNNHLRNFTCIFPYLKKFYVTNDDVSLYILNLEELKFEAIARNFRKIISYAISENEIFILEGGRSLIRLSNKPEPPIQKASIIFNPLLPPPIPHMGIFEAPIEYTEDENVIGAEECFELPPIESINMPIPIQMHIDSPDTENKKIIQEHKQRIETFQKISEQEFEEEILYESAKKRKTSHQKNKTNNQSTGIIEIGHSVDPDDFEKHCSISLLGTSAKKPSRNKETPLTVSNKFDSNYSINTKKNMKKTNIKQQIETTTNKMSENLYLSTAKEETPLRFSELPSLHYPVVSPDMESISTFSSLNMNKDLIDIKTDILTKKDEAKQKLTTDIIDQISICPKDIFMNKEINKDMPEEQITNNLSSELGGRGDELKSEDMPKYLEIPSIFKLKDENSTTKPNSKRSNSNDSQTSDWEFVNDGINTNDSNDK